ncbi:glycosyltransferase [Brachybacterium vulturis]|uniref:glycosyltransferase n=1 Tax=Brachybacterium vulturis TaxID=2017484 RepID=UPI003736B393
MSTLAGHFDAIRVVAAQVPSNASRGEMPGNVELSAAIPGGRGQLVRESFRRSGALRESMIIFLRDLRHVTGVRTLQRLVFATLRGRLVALRIRDVLDEDAWSDARVYFFWGAWGAYAMPWLEGEAATISVRFHGGDLYVERSGGYMPFRRSIFRRADRILTVSAHGRDYIAEQGCSEGAGGEGKVVLAPLGSPDLGLGPVPDGGGLQVVSCSAVDQNKRVGLILAGLKLLAEVGVEVRWTHFGDGPEMAALRQDAGDLPEGLTVELRGRTPRDEILAFYQETPVDVFVNASRSEGAPVSIMEALSFDIPVAAPAVGGIPGMLPRDSSLGVVFSADSDADDVASAIHRAAGLRTVGPGARRTHWEKHFDAHTNSTIVAELLGP